MPRIAVGVDAGGTKTAVVHSVDGKRRTVCYGASANASAIGAEKASDTIAHAVELALDGADPHAIFVGAAGAGREDVAAFICDALQARFPHSRVAVRDDAYIAFRAAIPHGDGAIVIAGTGSIGYAERQGEGFRCGGYGYLIGDGGSAFAIGRAAIKRLLEYYDDRIPRDELIAEAEARLQVRSARDVLHAVYASQVPVSAIADVAQLVLALAANGEANACRIIEEEANELAHMAKALLYRSGLAGSESPLALAGGLLSGTNSFIDAVEQRLRSEFPSVPLRKANPDPCLGALAAAEQML